MVPAAAQTPTWDTSGNGMLKGTYYFRQVYYVVGFNNGSLSDAAVGYGTVNFSGTGTFAPSSPGSVVFGDAQSGGGAVQFSGTYSIAASGHGFISNPITGDTIYGLVNAQGIFIGSATETANTTGVNDLFIAVPVGSPAATAATFKGNYSLAYMNLASGNPLTTLNAMLQLSPNGVNSLGTVSLAGYAGGSTSKFTQSFAGTYAASSGAMVLTFPNSSANLLAGQYYLYISPDGNFVVGGSPGNFDIFVGVRTGTGTPSFSGLYYQAGIDQDESQLGAANAYALLDTYYGSLKAASGALVGHQRVLELLATGGSYDYTYSENFSLSSSGTYSTPGANYVVGGGGIRIGSGIWPSLGISVALPEPAFTGSGVFLDPTGVVNGASSAPFTARIAPGELLTLYGSNLASGLVVAPTIPFPNSLGNVQVTINGVQAPIYYVSQTQVSVVVPYGVTGSFTPCTGCATIPGADIQVNNNGALSNIVSVMVGTTAPGVFTVPPGGLGYGATLHQDGSLVTTKNPAVAGETVSVFLTGLGAVSPAIGDGAAGPSNPFSVTPSGAIAADISGVTATVQFSGLAPGLAGLYQLNVTIPSGLTAGDNTLDIAGPDSYTTEVLIPIGGSTSTSSETPVATMAAKGAGRMQHRQAVRGRVIR